MKQLNAFITKFLPYILLAFAIGFNFFTLLPELSVKSDPNDNVFQFSLTQRMDEALGNKESPLDHWVGTWASGYPLPFYYQHLPHLFIATIYRLFLKTIPLYSVFKLVNFSFWVFFPLALFLATRKFGFSKLTAGLTAFFGSQVLADGLYGADASSFAWRGFGLSTQLQALFFALLALAEIYQSVKKGNNPRLFIFAVLLLSATFASHVAIGYIVGLSALFVPLSLVKKPVEFPKKLFIYYFRLFLIFAATFLLLSYWFVPLFLGNTYHNVSFWDPWLKWNSYGYREVISMFLDGKLFDFNRPPILTTLTVIGFFVCLVRFKGRYKLFALLFPLWILLYFGRTTWGSLIDILPMMKEMHLQRLLNGLHLVSFPLIGIGAAFLFKKLRWPILATGFIILLGIPVYKANANYLWLNRLWIKQANESYQNDAADFRNLANKIKELPSGRVYAGSPGNWGREFKVGATQVYLALSTMGLSMNGFLPESWSLNTDPEMFFNYTDPESYQLFNVRYLITPTGLELPKFAKQVADYGRFRLSQIETSGYFDIGSSNLLVSTQKTNIQNIIHLWLASDLPGRKEFPSLDLIGKEPDLPYTLRLKLSDNFFPPPLSYPLLDRPEPLGKIVSESVIGNHKFLAKIEVDQNCRNCLVVFKMTYHPNWRAFLDGQPAQELMVFPSFLATKVGPGSHEISFEYRPSSLKIPLVCLGIMSLIGFSKLRKLLPK